MIPILSANLTPHDTAEAAALRLPHASAAPPILTPTYPHAQAIFFLTPMKGKVEIKTIADQLIYGDYSANPLSHFDAMSNDVLLPLVTQNCISGAWPEMMSKEIQQNMQKMLDNMTITIGESEGTTKLPLPPEGGDSASMDEKEHVYLLETSLITWARQIKEILKADPEQELKQGNNTAGPEVEIRFWSYKARNLNAINEQLKGPRVQSVIEILESKQSTYVPSFLRLVEDSGVAMAEANDNVMFLKPLVQYVEKLRDMDEFTELPKLFPPTMHTIMMIWKHSKFYNTPSRVVVLMREICNDIISQAHKFLEPETIMEEEPQDAVNKLKQGIRVCGMLKTIYFGYKARVAVECPDNPWRFQNSALFARLDSFLERCHDILELSNTILQFSRLETVEVGGTKGKVLTTSVAQIFEDFKRAVSAFHGIEYDLLDVDADKFDDDFYVFRVTIKELERRLGSVVAQGFDDSTTVYGCFKVLDSFDVMLQREVIQQDLERKHVDLVQSFGADLKMVLEIFRALKDHPPIGRNMPPVAGAVNWIRGLKERISDPYERFKSLHANSVMESEETREIFKVHAQGMQLFEEYELKQFGAWCEAIESVGQDKLRQSLLVRYTDGGFDGRGKGLPLLRVNFDPALTKLLREVKYLKLLALDVPESAMGIYLKNEQFRTQIGNLDLLTNIYNNILFTMIDVEKPMIQPKLDKIDEELKKACSVLTWRSHGITDFIVQTMSLVKECSTILVGIKGHVAQIEIALKGMEENVMFERKEQKTYAVDDYQFAHETLIGDRHASAQEAGEKIQKLLMDSNKVLRISKGAQSWKTYVDYVAGIVIEGLATAISASISALGQQMDEVYLAKNDVSPLLEVKLELLDKDIMYTPNFAVGQNNELRSSITSWLKDFSNISKLVTRLDTGEGDYLYEIEFDTMLMARVQDMSVLLAKTEQACQDFADGYGKFEYLWVKDIEAVFQEFMADVAIPDGEEKAPEGTIPTLEQFDAILSKYKSVQDEVSSLPNHQTIMWLKIDSKPVKQSIATWVSKWSYRYTSYLSDDLTSRISDLMAFVNEAKVTLVKEVEGGDLDGLIEVMGCIRDVRTRTESTDAMFEPLRNSVALLKKWNIPVTEETLLGLEESPGLWAEVKKQNFNTLERLNPLQNAEASKIKMDVEAFNTEVDTWREGMKANGPFDYSDKWEKAFETLGKLNEEIIDLESRSKYLNEMQDLFGLTVTDYREIRNSRREVKYLKGCWDMASMVCLTFDDNRLIKWADINVDQLTDECKKLTKVVKSLDKFTKNWGVYKGIEDLVKNMMTSLPLVADLAHPAMRDRHWNKLKRASGKSFTMDENFSLGNLLSLGLHNFVEEVADIVDIAQKELIIEKQLVTLEANWEILKLEFVPYGESEIMLIQLPEELIEGLDDGQVQLQALAGSKYVAGNQQFQDQVNIWQGKLGGVDETVRTTWLEVQKMWTSLEPIFIGSADIRVQLPEDSKRFDGINAGWVEMMKEAVNNLNPIEAAAVDGRQEALDALLKDLELCNKSLADYLETKKVAFPRFYFVANADLLDILSKGSSPWLIQKHFSKNFDSIDKVKFEDNADGTPSKVALGMISPQGEYVNFHEPCLCDGPVEVWLNKILEWMRMGLKTELHLAVKSYEDKPRHYWQLDWSAQMSVLVSRIIYTEDTGRCFDQLEEGNDNAIRDYMHKCQQQLDNLSDLINGEMSGGNRKKTITLVTIDVHARDVLSKLINERCETAEVFQWQSQLRYRIDEEQGGDCWINLCDFNEPYTYEYIGNCGALVITPLTDRCYITLTQASRLVLGGAPAGPAGTGKTETTKDLGRALGIMVYVFNCSDQMDYRVMGNIYKGLASSGCWGCFDEFNRITIEVLSVCSTQYKVVLDGIRAGLPTFVFDDEEVQIWKTCMAFITMNPGYAGRTELPESLKALFRPVSMVVPDMVLITQIMLFSEGFKTMDVLARKFMLCYNLSMDLLSKADHYDWKLRAVKTTLCVAGSMKREAPDLSEDKVLLRAMRDFNIGKLLKDDVGIFMGLLNDLFPRTLELVPRARFEAYEDKVKESAADKGYQADETFVLKITQLREIFQVRWSVFLLGPAGCGKTVVWQTSLDASIRYGEKGVANTLNPKGVSRNELYGYVSIATREWKDGLLSQIFRDFSNNSNFIHEWIILDGDIDAEWIETMNTVMDDNKILTLVSGERIPLTPPMRLLFEIADLRNASPATVSRAGVIFINDDDIGWMPFVLTWLDSRADEKEREVLLGLFNKYVAKSLVAVLKGFKMTVPIVQINAVMTLCFILDGVLGKDDTAKKGLTPEQLEMYFVFGCVWAIGGNLLTDKSKDHRKGFSIWWQEEFKTVKFPVDNLIFDYQLNKDASEWENWSNASYTHIPGQPIGSLFVDIPETARLGYMMDLMIPNHHNVMFVGGAGTGKTCMMREKLASLDEDDYVSTSLALNSMTDSMQLQMIMEQNLEKKAGIQFGPPGNKTLIYFVDDMNMPVVDKYGTQEPIALLRCFTDYNLWYEREKLTPRRIKNCDIGACMNPTAGSFVIDGRFQRQFATFSCQLPPASSLAIVFGSILGGHIESFDDEVANIAPILTAAASELQAGVANTFLPSAVKFHYIFNLRDIANVFGGLCRSEPRFYSDKFTLVKLYLHEAERVYRDRLISDSDFRRFDDMHSEISKKHFSALEGYEDWVADEEGEPNIFTSFCTNTGDDSMPYLPVKGWEQLSKVLEDQLTEHNETNAMMNLVLFSDAMEHVSRIARIVEQPRGNALLVGVGGSGKQSLARLAAFICTYEVYQITVTASYGLNAFKEDLVMMYKRAGVKAIGTLWILTDQQIVDERFLVFMNDMLSSGDIPNLFPNEDIDDICNAVRPEVKQAGLIDTKENCWGFYIEKVRKFLHVALCFSPVGDTFRVRARQFPALVSCTQIDWFHAWSNDALIAVAQRFLGDMDNLEDELKENLANHMANVHASVTDMSLVFMEAERRRNYVTPKSFLELIALYKMMLKKKLEAIVVLKEKLESGLEKLQATAEMVSELQDALVGEQAVVEEKKAATDKLIVHIGQETQIAEVEKAGAAVDEEACAVIAADVGVIQADAEKELMAAEPIIKAAEAALASLDKGSLTELKAFGSPAEAVVMVVAATVVLTAGKPKVPKDLSWAAGKKMMANVGQFLDLLLTFDKDNVDEPLVAYCEAKFLVDPDFQYDIIANKSGAAAGLCSWCINICKYFRIYQMVAPKRAMLAEANAKLDNANHKLSGIRARLAELDAQLGELTDQFETATADKNAAIAQAKKTQDKADLATRLVNGLSSEGVRWAASIDAFAAEERTLIGDVMLASAFVSYIGSFTAAYRNQLVTEKWLPDMIERQVPMTAGVTPIAVLTNEAEKAQWSNENLPSDVISVENGAIICSSARWPLMIDPQLQGITWITERESTKNLRTVQLTTPKYLDQVEQAIVNGEPIIIENMGESIDAVLEPILARATIKKGRSLIIKLGEKEVDYDTNFQLYLQTKLSNPHYIPEVQAQCTMVNFTVTEKGLEEQLLALVVGKERPDLEAERAALIKAENDFKVQLQDLADNLLFRLANSEGDILEDIELIENLEETKKISAEIEIKVADGKKTAIIINKAREVYRPVATRGSLHFFLVDKLNALRHAYQYSMGNYVDILTKGIDLTPASEDLAKRIADMVDVSCFTVFAYVASGLFEEHKLVYASQLCFKIQASRGEIDPIAFDFLLRGGYDQAENPIEEWLANDNWYMIKALEIKLEQFAGLSSDMEGSAKRWREWVEDPRAEAEPLPGDWKRLGPFDRLLVIRCLRPDRMSEALGTLVGDVMGSKYTVSASFDLLMSYTDSRPDVPIFVFLSPGVDVMSSIEAMQKVFVAKNPESTVANKIMAVSLGQGQEPVANRAIANCVKAGGWVALQNIHLTPGFCKKDLEPTLDKMDPDTAHPEFRLFLTAEMAPNSTAMPIPVLQACVKLTNEPPSGMKANLKRSINYFTDDMLDECSKQAEFKNITFALSYFHACLLQRKKFGSIGFNFIYPFTTGDLVNCSQCCVNYLENNSKVPWNDLRYLVGEVMYGGHVFNDWDRRLTNCYLELWLKETLLDSLPFFPGFMSPPPMNMKGYNEFIDESFPPETPACFGMHNNAEIGYRLQQAQGMFDAILNLQPRATGGGGAMSVEDKSKMLLDDILEKLPDAFDMIELEDKLAGEERTPFTSVFLQEIERMNVLLGVMKLSLFELDLGLKGDLTISDAMENLMEALFNEKIPPMWEKKSYPTLRTLGPWVTDVLQRAAQLTDWTGDLAVPKVSWFPGFFNPQSFLTAVMQTTARKNEWPLDKTVVQTDVTKKRDPDEIEAPSREGAYICGCMIEGCRWDDKIGGLGESFPKELFASMPVLLVKAVTVDKAEQKDSFGCPVYKTRMRPKGALGHPDGGYIFTAGLKTKEPVSKWVTAGVALLADISGS